MLKVIEAFLFFFKLHIDKVDLCSKTESGIVLEFKTSGSCINWVQSKFSALVSSIEMGIFY